MTFSTKHTEMFEIFVLFQFANDKKRAKGEHALVGVVPHRSGSI